MAGHSNAKTTGLYNRRNDQRRGSGEDRDLARAGFSSARGWGTPNYILERSDQIVNVLTASSILFRRSESQTLSPCCPAVSAGILNHSSRKLQFAADLSHRPG
jgi:hypothetical protein